MANGQPACEVVKITGTVTDLNANPFYFGWSTAVDLRPAKAWITKSAPYTSTNTGDGNRAHTLNYVGFTPDPSQGYQYNINPTANSPVPDSYAMTSGQQTSIRGTQSVSIKYCVNWYS